MNKRLVKAINLVKQSEGMTEELTSKIDALYVYGKITHDEYAGIMAGTQESENEDTEEPNENSET